MGRRSTVLLRTKNKMTMGLTPATGSAVHIAGHGSIVGTSGRQGKPLEWKVEGQGDRSRAVTKAFPLRQVTSPGRRRRVSRLSAIRRACQRGSFWLPSCMCTSTAPARLLPAAERASRPTVNISTPPRCSAPERKCRVQPSSTSLSDRLELEEAHAHMYP